MPTSVLGLLTAEAHKALPMPTYVYGLLAVLGFVLLLAVTWAFRGAANRYPPPPQHHDGDQHH